MAVMVGIRLEGLLERPETALSGSPWLRLLPVLPRSRPPGRPRTPTGSGVVTGHTRTLKN